MLCEMTSSGEQNIQVDGSSTQTYTLEACPRNPSPDHPSSFASPPIQDAPVPANHFTTDVAEKPIGGAGTSFASPKESRHSAAAVTNQPVPASRSSLDRKPESQPSRVPSDLFDKPKLKSAFASALTPRPRTLSPQRALIFATETPIGLRQSSRENGAEQSENLPSPSETSMDGPIWNRSDESTLEDMQCPPKTTPLNVSPFPSVNLQHSIGGQTAAPTSRTRPNHTYVLPSGEVVHSGKGLGRGRPGIKRGPRKSKARMHSTEAKPVSRKRKRASTDSGMEHEVKARSRLGSPSDSGNEYSPQATQTRSGRHTQRPTTFVPPDSPSNKKPRLAPSAPMTINRAPTKRKMVKRKEYSALCEHCLRGYGPSKNAIVFCDGCNKCWHQRCHDPMIPRKLVLDSNANWFCHECALDGSQAEKKERTTGKDWNGADPGSRASIEAQRRRHLENLRKDELVDLLMLASTATPNMAIWKNLPPLPASFTQSPAPKNRTCDITTTYATLSPQKSADAYPTPTADSESSRNSKVAIPSREQNITTNIETHPDPHLAQNAAAGDNGDDGDDEGLLEDEHALLYPKPGNGVQLPPESEDLHMLLESNDCKTFSHTLREDVTPVGVRA